MIYAKNKKVFYDYEILETFEAGLVLSGPETKAVRTSTIKLTGAYVTFYKNDAYLLNCHIPRYKFSSVNLDYDPTHSRKLLLKRKEINYLRGKMTTEGLTIVPTTVYTKGDKIKIEIGLAKGKKKFDKRESIKKREQAREMMKKMKEN